jgi:hypothetical protein
MDVKFDDERRTNPQIPLRVLGALCGLAVKILGCKMHTAQSLRTQ